MTANMITLAEAITQRDAWVAASAALATSKQYTIGNRQLTRADGPEVRNMIRYWNRAIRDLEATAAGADAASPSIATFS